MKKSELDKIIREELQLVILENPARLARYLGKYAGKVGDLIKYRGVPKSVLPFARALDAIDNIPTSDLKRTSEILKSVTKQWRSLVPTKDIKLRGDTYRTMFPWKQDLDGKIINKVRFTGSGQVPEFISNFPKGKYSISDIEALIRQINNRI